MKRRLPRRPTRAYDPDLRDLVVGSLFILISVTLLCLWMRAAILTDCKHPPREVSVTGALLLDTMCPGWEIRQHQVQMFGWVFAGNAHQGR